MGFRCITPLLCPLYLRLSSNGYDFFSFCLKWYALIFFFFKVHFALLFYLCTQLKDVIV